MGVEIQLASQRVLVTGGAGFIGSHLVDALVNRGYEVTILDNLSSGRVKNIETHLNNRMVQLVKGDLRSIDTVKEASTDVDAVFHLAAITSVPYSVENPEITKEVNAKGTRNLLDASIVSNVKRFVYVSSCSVYGEPRYLPVDEDHPLDPISPYAESKIIGEDYCREFYDAHELGTVTLRLFNVYGSRQIDNEYSGVMTKFIRSITQGKPPIIYGDGKQTRDFVHVRDVVQALLLSVDNDEAIGEVFNIGSGKSVTIGQLCQTILRKLAAESQPIYREQRRGDIRHSYANISKAERILGFKPIVSLDDGLAEILRNTNGSPLE
jgi:UDP-glucose 4-epimerase